MCPPKNSSGPTAQDPKSVPKVPWGERKPKPLAVRPWVQPADDVILPTDSGFARCGPPQGDVIEKILRHCGLWHAATPRAPPAGEGWVHDPDGNSDSQTASSDEPVELTYVDTDTFWATF